MLEIRKTNAVTRIGFGGKLIDYSMLESLREAVTAAAADNAFGRWYSTAKAAATTG